MAAKDIAKLDYDYIKFWVVPLAGIVFFAVSIADPVWQTVMTIVSLILVAVWLYELDSKYKHFRKLSK